MEYMTLLMREREKYKEGEAKGNAYGIIKFTLSLGYSDKDILSALQETLNIDMDQATKYLKSYYEETSRL